MNAAPGPLTAPERRAQNESSAHARAAEWLRRLFSFPAMLGLGLAVVAVFTVSIRFNDPDMWWHLKIGEVIWNTHTIPSTDQFSFTAFGHPWVAHEWLAEVFIYAAYKAGGYTGLMIWLATLSSALLIAVYTLCYLRTRNALVSFLGGLSAWLFASVGLAIRPLLPGHILLAGELLLLELGRRNPRWLWLLPPLFAVWVNCHGSFVFGIFALAAYWICAITGSGWGPFTSEQWTRSGRTSLSAVLALSLAALFCNPIGVRLVTYPFNALFLQKTNLGAVQEWAPPELNDPRTIGLLVTFALMAFIPIWRKTGFRAADAMIALPAFVLAVQHTRMMFLFGVAATPALIALVAPLLKDDGKRGIPAANAALMAGFAIAIVLGFPDTRNLERQVRKANPVGAVEYIRKAGLKGPMLNFYVMGGYLMWALPEEKVFIDGRADIYDWTGVLAEYGRWVMLQEDPQLLLDRRGIRLCLLRADAPAGIVLNKLQGWTRVYSDETSAVYLR